MTEAMLCLAALLLLAWVTYLKQQVANLTEQNEKMAVLLKVKVEREKSGVKVEDENRVWGQKPAWMK